MHNSCMGQQHSYATIKPTYFKSRSCAMLAPPAKVDSHGKVSVAAVWVETVVPQSELDQGDVRGVHALQGDSGRADIPAGLCDEILQCLQHLLQNGSLYQASLKHSCCGVVCLRSLKRKKFLALVAILRQNWRLQFEISPSKSEVDPIKVQSLCC